MKIRMEERGETKEVMFFLTAEDVKDAAAIIRLSEAMIKPNAGYANFGSTGVGGWIKVPLKSNMKTHAWSGAWK